MNTYTRYLKIRPAIKIATMAVAFAVNTSNVTAATTTIDFETSPDGDAYHAPILIGDALTNLYAPLGVNFSGGFGTAGGQILDERAGFIFSDHSSGTLVRSILRAHSGHNFLNIPRQTELMLFDAPVTYVSAYVNGSGITALFFDKEWNAIAVTDEVSSNFANPWAFLEYSSTSRPIGAVYFNNANRMDDFTFGDRAAAVVPLPASLPMLAAAIVGLAALRRRNR